MGWGYSNMTMSPGAQFYTGNCIQNNKPGFHVINDYSTFSQTVFAIYNGNKAFLQHKHWSSTFMLCEAGDNDRPTIQRQNQHQF